MTKEENLYTQYYHSPIGILELASTKNTVVGINFVESEADPTKTVPQCLKRCIAEIDAYFNGKLKKFSVPVRPHGTDFQQNVWRVLENIPYGHTVSYGDIADKIDNPKAVRAVGGANGKNPISIIIPCHRVIGKDGSMTGYGGGIRRKEWLLSHEQKHAD